MRGSMRSIVQAFLLLVLVIDPIAGEPVKL
jgi:hypothetical protein